MGNPLKNYLALKYTGEHISGKVINYKRINNHGKLHPYIQFVTKQGEAVTTTSKSALPAFLKVKGRYYAINDNVEIAYNSANPKEAIILSYTSWLTNVWGLLVGLLGMYIAIKIKF